MARLEDFLDQRRIPEYIPGVGDRKENLLYCVAIGKFAAGSIRNQDCVAGDFRLAKCFHAFAEGTDNRKWKALDLDAFSDRGILAAIDGLGELLGDGSPRSA